LTLEVILNFILIIEVSDSFIRRDVGRFFEVTDEAIARMAMGR
jgi:hypothetical protein